VILIRTSQDNSTSIRGRAGDRVHPLDTVHIQTRLSNSFYPSLTYAKPAFDLPVIYEDDEIAIVDKPAGIVTYSHRKGGHGRMTVRAALPYCLKPPASNSTRQILRRPSPVHRLDKATSGLMVIAKTKGAMVDLSKVREELTTHYYVRSLSNSFASFEVLC
jgi:23S rRNA pseudouridine1911/1915/1917 synthase